MGTFDKYDSSLISEKNTIRGEYFYMVDYNDERYLED